MTSLSLGERLRLACVKFFHRTKPPSPSSISLLAARFDAVDDAKLRNCRHVFDYTNIVVAAVIAMVGRRHRQPRRRLETFSNEVCRLIPVRSVVYITILTVGVCEFWRPTTTTTMTQARAVIDFEYEIYDALVDHFRSWTWKEVACSPFYFFTSFGVSLVGRIIFLLLRQW